jgi:integrase
MRQKISKSAIDKLAPGAIIACTNPVGFVARRLPSGAVTYGFRYRDKHSGRQRWTGLGVHGDITPEQARKKALKVAAEVRDGSEPVSAAELAAKQRQAAGHTLDWLLDNFIARHVRPNLRSASEIERTFRVYVRPRLGSRSIYDLRRRDLVELLDGIEDNNGPVMADRVLAHLRKAFNWHAARDDQFVPPLVRGMARTKGIERARTRTLSDEELRDLWQALDSATLPAPFPKLVRMLLLSCQRRDEVSRIAWEEIEHGVWEIPASRYKTGQPNAVPLSAAARALIGDKGKGFIFTTDGKTPFSGFSKAKAALDAKVAEIRKQDGRKPMPHWVLHDLRRTGRSLMSRAGVPADHAERALGHVIPGVRGVYDWHSFLEEKRSALERLAALVERILQPSESVVRFPAAR